VIKSRNFFVLTIEEIQEFIFYGYLLVGFCFSRQGGMVLRFGFDFGFVMKTPFWVTWSKERFVTRQRVFCIF
jgi:hypothetical protein